MNEKTVDEAYAANAAIREKLKGVVSELSDDQLNRIPDGEKWSVANIVEHLSMVEGGATRICSKLLSKAKDQSKAGDGKIRVTNDFIEKGKEVAGVKLEAPDFVIPSGEKTLADSMAALETNADALQQLRQLFETVDSNEHKFSHPYFGGLSAGEWFTLIGAHEARHIRQIKGLVEKL